MKKRNPFDNIKEPVPTIDNRPHKIEKEKELPILYDTIAYGRNSLCSGFGVYPNGKTCKGCSDCTQREGFQFFGLKGKTIEKTFNKTHALIKITSKNKRQSCG